MNRIHESVLFVKYGTGKTKHVSDVHKVSQVLEDCPIRNFCHLGGCCVWNVFSEPLCVGVSGQESSKRVWKGWWGADVCEITRHAQPDPTHRHHSQNRALDGEQQDMRHRAGTWAEEEFCLGLSQSQSSRLVYLCVVPEPPQIGGFHIHQPHFPPCQRRLVPRSWIRKESCHPAPRAQATGDLPPWERREVAMCHCHPEFHLQGEMDMLLHHHLLWNTHEGWQWKHRLTARRWGSRI